MALARWLSSHLIGSWFNPDWDLDDPDWRDVVRRFAREEGAAVVANTARELRGHVLPEPELRELRLGDVARRSAAAVPVHDADGLEPERLARRGIQPGDDQHLADHVRTHSRRGVEGGRDDERVPRPRTAGRS